MKTKTSLRDIYSPPGFRARARFKSGILGDPQARVIQLERRQKKASALVAAVRSGLFGTGASIAPAPWTPAACASTWTSNTAAWPARTAA